MGNAILVTNNPANNSNTRIFAIPLVGLRTDSSTGELSNSVQDARPIAAIDDVDAGGSYSNVDISQEYAIPNGTVVLWARDANDPTSDTNMAGFFTSLNTNVATTGNGNQSLLTVLYPRFNTAVSGLTDPADIGAVQQCITLHSPCDLATHPAGPNLWPLTNWEICLASTRNDQWATLHVESSNGNGFSTEITYGKGGTPCT